MPSWILIVFVAQFINAIVAIFDKHIITSEKVSKPIVYAFFVSFLSFISISVFLLPFLPFDFGKIVLPNINNVTLPTFNLITFSILSGFAFFIAILTSYKAFKKADASDVVPVVGSVTAIFTFIISFLFLSEVLTPNFIYGFIFLVLGMIILSHYRFTLKVFILTFLSGLFFAIYFSLMKYLFNEYAFDQSFFWTRIGMLISVLIILLLPKYNKEILHGAKKTKIHGGFWIIGNNILGGIAGIALLKAVELGSVTIVQALNGLQFVFLILISVLFGKITPVTFGENNSIIDIVQKIISVSLIVCGFYLLFI